MIDYQTYLQIHHLHDGEKLKGSQIAERLGLDPDTVSKWLRRPRYEARKATPRPSKLDPFKPQILRWIELHPFTGAQVLQKLHLIGYGGGRSILNDYLLSVRPRSAPAFLKLHFDPGECAQVDWGECGPLHVGAARHKLQVFVMVLCHSRLLYLRFYPSQSFECFLDGHVRAFEFFGGVPRRVMTDNLRTAVLEHPRGGAVEYHPRYLELARHYGFAPVACNVGKGNEKGRVERGVGYIKDNFLGGRQVGDLASLQAAADGWRDQIANQRAHGTTGEPPRQRFEHEEKGALLFLRPEPYDCAVLRQVRVEKDCRVKFETNTYSVPPGQGGKLLTMRVYAERIQVHRPPESEPLATHARCYGRREDIEDPAHTRQLKEQRGRAREQNLAHDFRALGPVAPRYYEQLEGRHLDFRSQVRRILAMAAIHGEDKVLRALEDSLESDAVNAAYVEHLLAARAHVGPPASPLHLTRQRDQLELPSPQPDLDIYSSPRKPRRI